MLISVVAVSPSSLPVVATAAVSKGHGGLLTPPDLHHFPGRYHLIEATPINRDEMDCYESRENWLTYSINSNVRQLLSEPNNHITFDRYDFLDLNTCNRRMLLLVDAAGGEGAIPIDELRSVLGSTQKAGLPFRRSMKRRLDELWEYEVIRDPEVGLDEFRFSQRRRALEEV